MTSNDVLQELIKRLEVRYPNVLPDTTISIEVLRVLQGQQDVIKYIKQLLEADSLGEVEQEK